MQKFGILGGTFNPIHYGHLLMAERAREVLGINKIFFMPSGNPPHKDTKEVVSSDDRLKMVELAIEDNEHFNASLIEIERDGKTYTVDTLRELRDKHGFDAEIYFIIGADVLMDIPKWRSATELVKLCKFAAIQRPGYNKQEFNKQIEQLSEEYKALIEVVEMPLLDISSTDIRERISNKQSIKYLLPDSVIKYINELGLYS